MLLEAGLPTERINRVIGKAEQEPLFAENPNDPRNRRISIVLLRDNQSPQPVN
jgi:chemotaxis protein MotB